MFEFEMEGVMDFEIPDDILKDRDQFLTFLKENMTPYLSDWYRREEFSTDFFKQLGEGGWFNFTFENGSLQKRSAIRESVLTETLAAISSGIAVAVLAHMDLGFMGLYLFGSDFLKKTYGRAALRGEKIMCVGNTENMAGSDVAGIQTTAEKVSDGWVLNGTKAFVTNGNIADLGVITAVSDPSAERNRRLSMFLVDLSQPGITRKKLNKQVWIPSDLTRLVLKDVFVPDDHLLGVRGQGLQQVLNIFTHSRVPISALTLGTAQGAFDRALGHGQKRKVFGQPLVNFQAKAFEAADFHARIEAARLMLYKACRRMDMGENFRKEAAMVKYLSVQVAREVTVWAADFHGATSVMFEHPIHKYVMDVWGSSLGEGTQDVQKLVIFRELMKETGVTPEI